MALFFPSSVDTADIVTASAQLHWLQGALPVLTHVAALPAILFSRRIRAYQAFGALIISVIVSLLYHQCLSWPSDACFGLPVATLRLNDYIWSPYIVAVGAEFMLRLYVYPWVSIVSIVYLGVIIFSSLATPFSIHTQLLIVVMAALLLFVKTAFLDIGQAWIDTGANAKHDLHIEWKRRFHVPSLLIAAMLTIVALAGFSMDTPSTYWLTHSILWHVPIYLALYFIMLGTSRDIPGWYDVFRVVLHEHDGNTDDSGESASPDALPPVVFYSSPLGKEIEQRPLFGTPLNPNDGVHHYHRNRGSQPRYGH